jgi:O-antigen biosynthesis protein
MQLSIVIVNYNVKHFLWQCLHSVQKAIVGMQAEVFVVDNNSTDGSMDFIEAEFPWVIAIRNQENVGFSKANNQAMRIAQGTHILLLNPDTILEEQTLHKALAFMEAHPNCGGLGARMLDGKGQFLPESKRGLPTPAVAFYKIFGISKLFPRSPKFSRYHMGHLSEMGTHEVEVLAGAFMLMRKTALEKVGLLDEQFFMYGEDIDLSYRIVQGGFKNYYTPEVRIIHYKGESTKKGSINYVYVFYRAMVLFARKHFSARFAGIYSMLINMAIWLRASLSVLRRVVVAWRMPVLDFLMIYGAFMQFRAYWEVNHRFVEGGQYPDFYNFVIVPLYVLIWIAALKIAGGYLKPVRISRIIVGLLSGTFLLLLAYGLLPEELRFSRALILMGATFAAIYLPLSRFVLGLMGVHGYKMAGNAAPRIVVACAPANAPAIESLLRLREQGHFVVTKISGAHHTEKPEGFYGTWDDLPQMLQFFDVQVLVMDAGLLDYTTIISTMDAYRNSDISFEIYHPDAQFMIGSDSIHTQGTLTSARQFLLLQPGPRRTKRLFDVLFALLLLVLMPALVLRPKPYFRLMRDWFAVVLGFKSWVGFESLPGVPQIKKGAVAPYPPSFGAQHWETIAQNDYIQFYDVNTDFKILIRHFAG